MSVTHEEEQKEIDETNINDQTNLPAISNAPQGGTPIMDLKPEFKVGLHMAALDNAHTNFDEHIAKDREYQENMLNDLIKRRELRRA
jgi:hypothetical protein